MNDEEQTLEFQSPGQRAVVSAALAAFVSMILCYGIARPVVELLEVYWLEWLAYAFIPFAVAFAILYRSGWHREISGAARTCSVLVLSCVILVGVVLAIGVMLSLLLFCFNAVSGGNH